MSYPFVKGHGTENDFVLLLDPDGSVHGELDLTRVRALCDRRAGIGGDGVLRVVRTAAYDALDCSEGSRGQAAEWFMDYRNADGSVSEMCGNGVRVLARFLADEGIVDPAAPLAIGSRGGTRQVTCGPKGTISVDMGVARVRGTTWVEVDERRHQATHVDTGNPHAAAEVDDLAALARELARPAYDIAVYPDGVNVELWQRVGPRWLRMRVHERGSGETRSCGTGVVAAAVAAANHEARPVTYQVDVPGGRLAVLLRDDGRATLTGTAEVVARGELRWSGSRAGRAEPEPSWRAQ